MATTARRQGILLPLWARIAIALQGITSTLPPAAVFLTALNIPHGYDPLFLLYMFLTFGFVGFGLVFIIALTIIGGMSTTLTLQTAWVLEVAKAVVATLAWCSMVFLLWPVGWMGGVVGCLWVGLLFYPVLAYITWKQFYSEDAYVDREAREERLRDQASSGAGSQTRPRLSRSIARAVESDLESATRGASGGFAAPGSEAPSENTPLIRA